MFSNSEYMLLKEAAKEEFKRYYLAKLASVRLAELVSQIKGIKD